MAKNTLMPLLKRLREVHRYEISQTLYHSYLEATWVRVLPASPLFILRRLTQRELSDKVKEPW
jgi:hypothetical protein